MSARRDAAKHYAAFLRSQLHDPDVAVLVADREGTVLGYIYVEMEGRNWRELRDEAGFIHDIVVAPEERRGGIAKLLLQAATEWLIARGAPRVLLLTAHRNEAARRLFASVGFRETMVEMTLELEKK